MTSDTEEISPVAATTAAAVVDERIRSLSTASEASEDSATALLPDVTFGPGNHTGMGSPRSNRESQPLLGARHDLDDFNHWAGANLSSVLSDVTCILQVDQVKCGFQRLLSIRWLRDMDANCLIIGNFGKVVSM